ncbi:GNAT family N-acetyltransferase [Polaribacter sp.]|jgi:GNAT superfamily N-acetyltransferase|uniref:GNAT family N-acetyltransferase n=1 Tax=Polaribacter sp. TaxID=1920175 RepID=UPI0007144BC3|nr:MAG: GNAT family acetyltransferase [Cryomorphaceae bacterium BACL22 MAG-120619-bin32]
MSFFIRQGQPKDVQAILDLIIELAVFEKEPNAVEITTEDLLKDGFSDNPKLKFFVAEENSIIIGMALFYERYSTWKGKTIHLEDLIVTHQKRALGIGKGLYTAVLKYAFDNNFKRVAWEVLDWNTNAIEFYKSTGATYLSGWHVVQMSKENLAKFIQNSTK